MSVCDFFFNFLFCKTKKCHVSGPLCDTWHCIAMWHYNTMCQFQCHVAMQCHASVSLSNVIVEEVAGILWHCHNSPYGGHFNGESTTAKVLQSGFYWPTLFKDAHVHGRSCDMCLKVGIISRRNEMTLQAILEVEVFDF